MSRHAILIGNSVADSDLEKSISAASLTRTINRYKALLENLDESHRFEVSLQIDRPVEEIRQRVSKLGKQAAKQDDLLLIHYFGHGTLSQDGELLLVHPGEEPGEVDTLPIKSMETRIDESGVQKSLMLLDCCYSGAVARSFQFTLRGEHCRIGSTVPTQKAYIEYKNLEAPIGFFTQAAMDALTDSAACISATDDRVTAQSLFDFITTALDQEALAGLQKPTMAGRLQEAIWVYQEVPSIARGFSSTANPKSAYAKIVSICKVMRSASFVTIKELHKRLTSDPLTSRSFKTLFKRPDETFVYIAVKIEVVARYVRLMERMGLVERGRDIRLTRLGRELGAEPIRRTSRRCLVRPVG